MRILADENIPGLEQLFDCDVEISRVSGRDISAADIGNADALFVRSVTRVNRQLLQGSPVRFVGTATSGIDHIDLRYLRDEGIGFAHAPGANANSVVEYVLAAIAAVDSHLERLLNGAVVGIVGYGHVGQFLAQRLTSLGIKYKVCDPWLEQEHVSNPAELADVLACDVVSLHCELTSQQPWPSYHLIGPAELRSLAPDCLFINASRGAVVDNLALSRLLNERDSQKVVLDVWEAEPDISHSLLEAVAIGTAHIAGYSLDGKLLASRMLADAVAEQFGIAIPGVAGAGKLETALSGNPKGAELVRALVQSVYDISYDDALLRGAVTGAGAVEVRDNFDQLRKQYRIRRELSGSRVKCAALSASDAQLLAALGCEYEEVSG